MLTRNKKHTNLTMAPFLSSMKLLLSSSLLLALLVSCCAYAGRKTMKESHFHTLEISSLLPASVCTPSAGSIKTRQSRLEVFYGHGPCSKLSQDDINGTSSTASLATEILSNDQSRVDYIGARLNNHKFNNEKANLPVQPGKSYGTGNYLVTVGIGSPKKTLTLVFDTGSDLTWTQCQPCANSCYTQQDPIFDPSSSTSYSNITCDSSQCSQLTSATRNNPGCSAGTCLYEIQYADLSFSMGFLSKDTLSITTEDVFPNFVFGCGQNNRGLFGKSAGLIGLARNPLSLISQTSQTYGKYFSYCLPSTSSSTGFLTLGKDASPSTSLKFTPFDSSHGLSFYFITITSISVGSIQLPINQTDFQKTGTVIDSGTTITRLPPTVYSALSTAFKQQMSNYTSAPAFNILDTCFEFANYTSITIPTVSFTFEGNVKVDLAPSGILVIVNTTRACLAFAGNSTIGIFGNTQQKTLEVAYDVAGGMLGFGAGGCT